MLQHQWNVVFILMLSIVLWHNVRPVCGQGYYQLFYNVTEEQDPGWIVGKLLEDTGLGQYQTEHSVELHFGYLESGAPYQGYFNIDQSGILWNIKRLNRESLCPNQNSVCQLELNIRTEPHNHVHNIKVFITVDDINDNSPSFDDRNVAISVSESTAVGAPFVLPAAIDLDTGKNGIQTAKLEPEDNHPFRLEGTINPDGTMDLRLILEADLDRETQSTFYLFVEVSDGGSPAKTGRLSIDVTVMDANDNTPKFTNTTYEVTTDENIPTGTTVFQVQAYDPDQGQNGAIAYDFVRSTKNAHGNLFGIDRNSGGIYTKAELDREDGELYRLSVLAEDGGMSALTAYTKVNIHIRDENDNAPSIKISALNGAHANIPEDSPPGSYVAHIVVSDKDKDRNGEFMCEMTSDQFELVYLYGNEYKIVTKGTFDRETVTNYSVTLKCDDFGQPPKSTKVEIPVFVTDINDHKPVFVSDSYHLNLNENNPIHSSLFQVEAKDKDIGVNSELTYTIQYNPTNGSVNLGDLLSIDAEKGTVFANVPFDHENGSFYSFIITATDHGETPLSAEAVLTVSIVDVNDERPQFDITGNKYKFGTFENQQVGTEIGTVMAYDKDASPYNVVSYMLDHELSDLSTFQIEETTGKITTKRMLDREAKAEYQFAVIAFNKGTPLMTSINVTLQIADKNDNPPFIRFPHTGNDTVKIMGDAVEGDRITTVLAYDIDIGENADLEYKIVYRNDDDLFDIDPVTGVITLHRDCDASFYNKMLELVLVVSDMGSPSLSSTENIYIFINGSIPAALEPPASEEEGSDIAVIIICVLVLIIIVIIIVLFALFMLRRRRLHLQRQHLHQKYQCRIEATKNMVQLNTSGNSVRTEATDVTDSSHNKSGYQSAAPDVFGQHGHDVSYLKQQQPEEQGQHSSSQSYHPIYVQKLPAHSAAVVQYNPDVSAQEVTITKGNSPTSGYNHLGEVQLQVHDLLLKLDNQEVDLDSSSSVTDSGKGSSEGDIIHRTSPLCHIDNMKKYSLNTAVHFPVSANRPDHHQNSYVVNRVEQPQHSSVSAHIPGPLARSSGRQQYKLPFLQNNSESAAFEHQSSPILKGCMQDKRRGGGSDSETPGKKKTVHFVKPFSRPSDLNLNASPHKSPRLKSNRPAQVTYLDGDFCNQGESKTDDLDSSDEFNQNISSPRSVGDNNFTLGSLSNNNNRTPTPSHSGIHSSTGDNTNKSPYMEMRGVPPRGHPYLIGQRRDSLSDCEGDSQGGYSDGDTTTSGSYCMDDEDVIGPDVYV